MTAAPEHDSPLPPARAADSLSLVDALVQTSYAVTAALTAVAAGHDVSVTLLRVLAILRDRTPTMSDLADHLDLDRSSITGLIARAERRGLVHRSADGQDGRSIRVRLTPSGHTLADSAAHEVRGALVPLEDRLSPRQSRDLTRLLVALGVVH